MIILAHRGTWFAPDERNTAAAFERAFAAGFGVETDMRDHDGRLVIAHDPPSGDGLMSFGDFLGLYVRHGAPGELAINIKADGLSGLVEEALARARIDNAFVFDMSAPETLRYLRGRLKVFTRESEYEAPPAFYDRAEGVWLDCFERDWIDETAVARHLAAGKAVCVVSPELHGRPHEAAWSALRGVAGRPGVMLCTDFPDAARDYFA